MKKILVLMIVLVSVPAFAHLGGHGPKTDGLGKYGGMLASVVDKKQMEAEVEKLEVLYKAELIRSADSTVRVYIYDLNNDLVELDSFAEKAPAIVEVKGKDGFDRTEFVMTKDKKNYIGKAPRPKKKPFNIEVTLESNKRLLYVAFENLD